MRQLISTLPPALRFQFDAVKFIAAIGLLLGLLVLPACSQGLADDKEISTQDTYLAMQEDSLVLIDVRTPEEWADTGIAQGAHTISMLDQEFITKLDILQQTNPDKRFAFICASGNRSGVVQAELARRGYQNMFSVFGGTTGSREALGWIRDGLPIEPWTAN